MSFLDEIRKQSHPVRLAMFALSVTAAVSVVGVLWFQSFQRQLYAAANPGKNFDQVYYANRPAPTGPFALVGKGLDGLRAQVYSFLDINSGSAQNVKKGVNASGQVYLLPLAGDR